MKSPGSKYLASYRPCSPSHFSPRFPYFPAPQPSSQGSSWELECRGEQALSLLLPAHLHCCPRLCLAHNSDEEKLQPSIGLTVGEPRATCLETSVILAGNRTCSEQSPPKSIHTEHAPAAYLCSAVRNRAPVGGTAQPRPCTGTRNEQSSLWQVFSAVLPSCDQMLACCEGRFWSRAAWGGSITAL